MSDIKPRPDRVEKSDSAWRQELTPMQYAVLREKATAADQTRLADGYLTRLAEVATEVAQEKQA